MDVIVIRVFSNILELYKTKKELKHMTKSQSGFTLIELMVIIIILGFCVTPLLITPWTLSNLNWILTAIKGHPVHTSYWLAFGLTLLMNWISLAFNIIIEIIRLVF